VAEKKRRTSKRHPPASVQRPAERREDVAVPKPTLAEHFKHPLLEALAPAERTLIELLYLADEPVELSGLERALGICRLDPFWDGPNQAEAKRRVDLLKPLMRPVRDGHFAPLSDPELRRAALHSLVWSGRAGKVARVLEANTDVALAEVEPMYHQGLRRRLRVAAALGGAGGRGMALGQYPHSDATAAESARGDLQTLIWPRDPWLVMRLAPFFAGPLLAFWLRRQLFSPDPDASAVLALACARLHQDPLCRSVLTMPLMEHALLRGEAGEMASLGLEASVLGPAWQISLQAQASPAAGVDSVESLARLDAYERACVEMRKLVGAQYVPIGLMGKLHLALLTVSIQPIHVRRREQLQRAKYKLQPAEGLYGFEAWLRFQQMQSGAIPRSALQAASGCRIDDQWWIGLLNRWLGVALPAELQLQLEKARDATGQAGYRWMAAQIEDLLDFSAAARAQPDMRRWVEPRPAWEAALQALGQALKPLQPQTDGALAQAEYSQLRVEVLAHPGYLRGLRLKLFEQRPAARGGYTAGREMALDSYQVVELGDRLAPGDTPDRRLHSALIADRAGGYYGSFAADSNVVLALVGHPRLTDAEDKQPIRLLAREPALSAKTLVDGRVELSLDPLPAAGAMASLRREGDQLILLRLNPLQRRLATILAEPLQLPPEGLAAFMKLLPDMQAVLKVESALHQLDVQDCEPNLQLVVQLEPWADGLALQLGLRPLGEDGPFVLPGQGAESVLGMVQGRPARCRRALALETAAVHALQAQVPLLQAWTPESGLQLQEPEAALELLAALQVQPELRLEWKASKPLKLLRPQLRDPMRLDIAAKRDWFAAEGGLSLEDGSVIALGELLRALPSAQGRFLRLEGERILALDAELRRRLHTLRVFADERGEVQVPAAAAHALEAVLDANSQLDAAFRKQLQRMEEARALTPRLPRTLQAELRDYQIEGFRFLARLAAWGAGACLADDMGLGKTVQSLALLGAGGGADQSGLQLA
jgi:hypothetical protein